MMDLVESKVAFALECKSVKFFLENGEKAIAIMPVSGKHAVPISLIERNGQPRLDAHLPFEIKGRAAWLAFRFFCREEAAFGLGIDYIDGETLYTVVLEASTVESLEKAICSSQSFLSSAWDDLDHFAELSAGQSEEDASAFDVSGLIQEAMASCFED